MERGVFPMGDWSTSITVNGTTYTRTGLANVYLGLLNGDMFPGPLTIRFSSDSSFTMRSLRITGENWAGPLWMTDAPTGSVETDIATVPIKIPATGTWQPEFSFNGRDWTPFGGTVTQATSLSRFGFACLVAPQVFARLREIPEAP